MHVNAGVKVAPGSALSCVQVDPKALMLPTVCVTRFSITDGQLCQEAS